VAFERGERQRFTLQVLQMRRDTGLEAVRLRAFVKYRMLIMFYSPISGRETNSKYTIRKEKN